MPIWRKAKVAEPTVKPYEARSGGFRVDENNVEYYLTPSQIAEHDRLNLEVVEDKDFWAAFAAMRVKYGIKPYTRYYVDDAWESKSESWWKTAKSTAKDWWGATYRKGMSWASDKNQKLAIALQHVTSVVRTVDDNNPPMSVRWTQNDDDASWTDFSQKVICISPEPIKSGKLSDAEALDIVTGYALHEGSHALYTKPLSETLNTEPLIHPIEVAALLMNILEDPRIERLTSQEYPGFAEYIVKALDYSWSKRPSEANPEIWGDLKQKVNSVIVIARWLKHVRVDEWANDGGNTAVVLADPSFDAEIPWWTEWLESYIAGKVPVRDAIQAGIDRLMDDEMRKRIEESKAREDARGHKPTDEDIKRMLKRLIDELGIKQPCDDAGGDPREDGISAGDADEIEQLVESKTKEVHAPDGDGTPRDMFHSRPVETTESQRYGRMKMSPIMQRLKAAIQLRPELPQYEDRILRSGEIDEEELYRFGADDYRIFREKHIREHPSAAVTLLVDMSGSMNGYTSIGKTKIAVAQELAMLFVDALRTMEGVSPKVMGHTGDIHADEIQLYELWTKGDNLQRLGLVQSLPHCENYDGHAISWCVQDLMNRAAPGDQMVLIVLSDGQPAGTDYGGSLGIRHVRQVTDNAERKGVAVIQIAIDQGLRASEQQAMFKHWVPFTSMDALPKAFEKVLARAINA